MHHAAPDAVRVKRPRRARALDGEELLATKIVRAPSKPGVHRKVPGLFCCLRQGIGDDAPRASSRMPRWRNRHTHASQKRATPGSNPGWGTRHLQQTFCITRAGTASGNTRFALSQFGCGTTSSARAGCRADEVWMTHVQTWLNGQSATLPASRRGFETCCLHQILFPSSNGEDRGPSSRVCRFKSGRERHGDAARSRERLPCKQEGVGWTPTVSTHSL